MKPQNKLQRRVTELSKTLPHISKQQEIYAFEKCFAHKGYRTKKHTICMDCGKEFQTIETTCKCPVF